jgi:hypothetical protein
VSDLYNETTTEPDTSPDPVREADTAQQYETADTYTETNAEVEARIADQDELPTPAESREATWGDNPDYDDEADLDARYDADIDAFLAEQDELPTPQESRAKTWGDNPDYYDETDLASEPDAGNPDPDSGHTAETRGVEDDLAEPDAQEVSATGSHSQDAASITDEHPVPAEADPATTEPDPELSSEQHEPDAVSSDIAEPTADDAAAADRANPTTDEPDQAGATESNADAAPSPDAERISALEAENADFRQQITDANKQITELKAQRDEQTARVDRIEQFLASSGWRPDSGNADPDQGVDKSETVDAPDPATKVSGKDVDSAEQSRDKADDGHPSRWNLPSDTALSLGATTAGGILTAVADHVPYLHADIAGMMASGVGVGAAYITWMRSKREGKHDHRSKD